jgi:kynurenine formamidase
MSQTVIIDLSVPTESSPSDPVPFEVIHEPHSQSIPFIAKLLGCQESELPENVGPADDLVKMKAHAGTHVDAPWHYSPVSEGRKARTIDEIPLEWFYGNGVVLDMRHKPNGSKITVDDVQEALRKIDYGVKPWDIVLIQTGADKLWGKKEYFTAGCGMTKESTLWLINQGVRVMGIDAWGWDRPVWATKEEFQKTRNPEVILEAHRAGIEKEFCHIEKLANLDRLPRPFGFKVACFPVKLTGGSAGWCRAVAITEK